MPAKASLLANGSADANSVTSPLRPSFARPVTVTGRPSASFGRVVTFSTASSMPWTQISGSRGAVRSRYRTSPSRISTRSTRAGNTRSSASRTSGTPAAVFSSFFARLLITIFGSSSRARAASRAWNSSRQSTRAVTRSA